MIAALAAWLLSFGQPALEAHILSVSAHIYTSVGECSGSVVRASGGHVVILTAKHCTENQQVLWSQFGGKTAKYRKIIRVVQSKNLDLATIEIAGVPAQPVAELAQTALPRGGAFTLIGLSDDVPWAISRGFVMSDLVEGGYDDKHRFMFVPIACQGCDEGDSGAGIFNTKGELAGVFVAGSQDKVRGYYVSLSDTRKFIWKNR